MHQTLRSPFLSLLRVPLITHINIMSRRGYAASDLRPKKVQYKKAFKGFYPTHSGNSLRATTLINPSSSHGLMAMEGGRLSDTQLDVCLNGIKKALKGEKGAEVIMRVFPDRPVSGKPSEVRMGKGKGYVEYYATWIAEGRMLFEVSGARVEVAVKALKVAAEFIPVRSRIIRREECIQTLGLDKTSTGEKVKPKALEGLRLVAPRVLPFFIRKGIEEGEKGRAIEVLRAADAADKDGGKMSTALLKG